MSYCRDPECVEEASVDGYCDSHYRRKLRGGQVSGPIRERPTSPRQRLRESALRYADADSEGDTEYDKADRNLMKSAISATLAQPKFARLLPLLALRGHHHPGRRTRRQISRWMQLELFKRKDGG